LPTETRGEDVDREVVTTPVGQGRVAAMAPVGRERQRPAGGSQGTVCGSADEDGSDRRMAGGSSVGRLPAGGRRYGSLAGQSSEGGAALTLAFVAIFHRHARPNLTGGMEGGVLDIKPKTQSPNGKKLNLYNPNPKNPITLT
jgi:hypothetical protein